MKSDLVLTAHYDSPLGRITMASDGESLIGLWFDGQKHFGLLGHGSAPRGTWADGTCPVLDETREWLDLYFSGQRPSFTPRLHLLGTPFRQAVWQQLLHIPYGQTTTYGTLANRVALNQRPTSMAARAVGGAVGHNPIAIIVPCHRVVGSNGSLTGYASGTERKLWLLRMEENGTRLPAYGRAK